MLDYWLYKGFSYSLPRGVNLCQGKYLFAGFAIIPPSRVIPRSERPQKDRLIHHYMTATSGFNHDWLPGHYDNEQYRQTRLFRFFNPV
jgi:hypothetical protein